MNDKVVATNRKMWIKLSKYQITARFFATTNLKKTKKLFFKLKILALDVVLFTSFGEFWTHDSFFKQSCSCHIPPQCPVWKMRVWFARLWKTLFPLWDGPMERPDGVTSMSSVNFFTEIAYFFPVRSVSSETKPIFLSLFGKTINKRSLKLLCFLFRIQFSS